MDRNDITILVNSCDAYEDIWDPFFRLFRVYWEDCPYEIVLNTESKKYELEGINIQCLQLYSENKKVPYGKRILEHLKYVKTKYVLILIDDFFLNDYVDNNEIEKCRTWMEDNQNIAAFFFAPVKDQGNIVSEKYKGYEKRPKVGVYKVSFQAALWRTTDFIESWKKHENPWEWEKQATFRSFFNNKEYYVRSKDAPNPIDYGAKYGEAWNVVAGLWCVESVDENFRKNGIDVDYEKRGILRCPISELPRDNKKKTIRDEISKIRSIGGYRYLCENLWRSIRGAKKIFGIKNLEKDYYEHLRNVLK